MFQEGASVLVKGPENSKREIAASKMHVGWSTSQASQVGSIGTVDFVDSEDPNSDVDVVFPNGDLVCYRQEWLVPHER